MRRFRWDEAKNEKLIRQRRISFEEVLFFMSQGYLLDIIENPNRKRYPHQRAYVIEMYRYVYLVPFVERQGEIFLKTIIPSRKLTKIYLKRRQPHG